MPLEKILMVAPRGFCAGVVRAVDIVEEALQHTRPVYVRKEIVHNKFVVSDLASRGAIFVNEIAEVPAGTPENPVICVFSAHGVSPEVRAQAKAKNLFILDATCPLVTKVHLKAIKYAREGFKILLIGHDGHEEVEGTMGEAPQAITLVDNIGDVARLNFAKDEKLAYLTQTTLSVDETLDIIAALKARFPQIVNPGKEDICYATTNRQAAVKDLAPRCELILVIGAQNSSNSKRLREVAQNCGTNAHLIDDEHSIRDDWFGEDVQTVGISAGASAPEVLVQRVIENLKARGAAQGSQVVVETLDVIEENVFFPLPKTLQQLPVMSN